MAVAHHRRRNGRGRRRCDLLGHVLIGIALAVAFAVRDVGVAVDVRAFRCGRILVHICANRAAVRHVRVHVSVDVLRGAGRDIRVQVRVIRRTCRTALVEIAVRVEVRRARRTLIEVAIGVQIGAVNRAGRCAVNSLINRAGRNIGILYVGDNVQLSGTAIGNFNTKDVATASTVSFSGLSLTGTDASNYSLQAHANVSATISQKAVTLTAPTVSKIYDGSAIYSASPSELTALSAQLGVNGDTITGLSLIYNDKNVAEGKTLTPSNAVIADGQSGGNYILTYVADNHSTITRLNSVTWTGGSSGNWFDPANWAGGAVPDLANVANVVIPANVQVAFDNTQLAGASSGSAVQIDGLGSQGGLNMQAGTLQVGSGGVTLDTLSQSGGSLTSIGSMSVGTFNMFWDSMLGFVLFIALCL